jgi:hypothetical protein
MGGALLTLALASAAMAEVTINGRAILFYTDDVGIFSATRRLSRDGDPTQPALDTRLTDKGSDVVFEPDVTLAKTVDTGLGTTELSVRGQGFIYTDKTRFNHGTLRVEAVHPITSRTRVRLRYYYAPHLLIGDNEDRQPGADRLVEEIVTSQIGSVRVEHQVTPDLELRLLGRYGTRRYNAEFAQRDTDFWTIGPHLDWRLVPWVKLGISYHYERGLAEGRKQPQFEDDVSYVNHYGSADLDIELMERLSLLTAFHYERNNWSSGIVGDERRAAHETILQGEVALVRQVTESWRAFVGIQRSSRKQSFESETVKNTNVGAGVAWRF